MKIFQVRYLWLLLVVLWGVPKVSAQNEMTSPENFDLKACVEYALQHHPSIASAKLDARIAEGVVGETRSIGLPQVNGELSILDNYQIQTQFLPAVFFAEDPINNPPPADAPPVGVQFGTQFNGDFNVQLSQLIFDGTYFLGLKAADVYSDLARRAIKVSEADVAETVTKAYYGVLVARERQRILSLSTERVGQLLKETKAFYENGLVEELDVDRLEVTYTNLETDLQRLKRFEQTSLLILKYQMGMDVDNEITLTQTLAEAQLQDQIIDKEGFTPADRPEYSVLQVQKELNMLDVKRYKVGYLPSLAGFFSVGFNSGTNTFQQYKLNDDTWFRYGRLGFSLSIPIFDGFKKKYQIQQAELELEKTRIQENMLLNTFKLEQQTSLNSLESNINTLESQAKNRKLAEKVVSKTKIKYKEGVGSSLEVIEAENDLNTALNNYYSALYDALLAKVEYDRSLGKLLEPYKQNQSENE